MGLLPVCQDAVGDVSDGQTNGPRALTSTLHDIEGSGGPETLATLGHWRGSSSGGLMMAAWFPTCPVEA